MVRQNIDATINRSTNNRTTNNRTISVKNDNGFNARQLLCVIEHSLTRPWLTSITGQTIITVKHPNRLNFDVSDVFFFENEICEPNVLTFIYHS